VPCSASWVVPGAHRVVGPGTHRGSGPREVHTIVHKVVNRKVVDLTTLYNFYKGRLVFFSTDLAQITAKL
jgi:hypothetical protein